MDPNCELSSSRVSTSSDSESENIIVDDPSTSHPVVKDQLQCSRCGRLFKVSLLCYINIWQLILSVSQSQQRTSRSVSSNHWILRLCRTIVLVGHIFKVYHFRQKVLFCVTTGFILIIGLTYARRKIVIKVFLGRKI